MDKADQLKVLITGGNGFVGSNLVEYFRNKGHNLVATYRNHMPKKVVEGVRYIKQDLSHQIRIDEDFDVIVHTAACSYGSMEDFTRDNIDSARQLVKYARARKIGTIIYFSTRSIYGEIRTNNVTEETEIINPDKYGMTKYIAEKIFEEAKDINTIGLRTPGIVGPNAHNIWLTALTEKIRNGENVEISDFETKNFAGIKDVSKFIEKLIYQSLNGEKFKYKVVNIACKESCNNIEIANCIKKYFKSDSIISVIENPNLFILNANKAFEMGFEPSNPLEIVEEYLKHLK